MPTERVPILARVDEQRAARGRRLARSTAIFALATGISRVLGLVREIVAAYYFGAAGQDQRLHGRLPGAEPLPLAGRRRCSLVGLRPRLQRAAREGRSEARLACRLQPLLADAARPRRAHGTLDRVCAACDQTLRRPRRRLRSGGRPLTGALPDRRAARGLRRDRRNPQQLRPVHRPRVDTRLLEPGDHRGPRAGRPAGGLAQRASSTSTPSRS